MSAGAAVKSASTTLVNATYRPPRQNHRCPHHHKQLPHQDLFGDDHDYTHTLFWAKMCLKQSEQGCSSPNLGNAQNNQDLFSWRPTFIGFIISVVLKMAGLTSTSSLSDQGRSEKQQVAEVTSGESANQTTYPMPGPTLPTGVRLFFEEKKTVSQDPLAIFRFYGSL